MKKILVIVAVVAMSMISAKAEYLYWQATSGQYDKVGLNVSTDYSQLLGRDSTGAYVALGEKVQGDAYGSAFVENASNYSSYYVELYSYDSSNYVAQGKVGPVSDYSQFSVASALSGSSAQLKQMMAVWNNATVSRGAVPEPTSGLMMLVGMALLGLKRRRV